MLIVPAFFLFSFCSWIGLVSCWFEDEASILIDRAPRMNCTCLEVTARSSFGSFNQWTGVGIAWKLPYFSQHHAVSSHPLPPSIRQDTTTLHRARHYSSPHQHPPAHSRHTTPGGGRSIMRLSWPLHLLQESEPVKCLCRRDLALYMLQA